MKVRFVQIMLAQWQKAHSPPLGVLYLAAVLRHAGHEPVIDQFCHIAGTPLQISDLRAVLDGEADVVGVSCMINAIPLLVAALRDWPADRPLLLGGPGIEGIAAELVSLLPPQAIIAGQEFEHGIVALCEAAAAGGDLADIGSVTYRDGREIVQTERRPRLAELDTLPMPAFDLVDRAAYHGLPILASRGCPFFCSFCDVAPAWGRLHRRHSVERVVAEMRRLRELGSTEVGFVDDLFILDRKWLVRFCEALCEEDLQLAWSCTGHVRLCDGPMAANMAEVGCTSIYFGVESGSDAILRRIRKSFSFAQAWQTLTAVARHVDVKANLTWGYPFETPADLMATLRALDNLRDAGVDASLMMIAPLASSDLYKEFPDRLRFDDEAPNVFWQDYIDARPIDRAQVRALIEAHPRIFCAFYRFESDAMSKLRNLHRLHGPIRRASSKPKPQWTEVC